MRAVGGLADPGLRLLNRDEVFAYLKERGGDFVPGTAVTYDRVYRALRRLAEVLVEAVSEGAECPVNEEAGFVVERLLDDYLPFLEGIESNLRPPLLR